jgi:phenylpropionate dioxygenase-like ring-hydroxylating dioxygenase large terminal subunit
MPPRNGVSRALPSAEVDHRVRRAVVDGIPVLLARLSDGQAVAFGATCPHQGNPLDEARIWCDELDCPYHHYTYDLRTGHNGYPARVFPAHKRAELRDLVLYEVEEHDGYVWVGPRRRAPAPADPGGRLSSASPSSADDGPGESPDRARQRPDR